MDGPIVGDMDSGDRAVGKLKLGGGANKETYSTNEEVHPTNIPIDLTQEQTQKEIPASIVDITSNKQVELEELTYKTEAKQQGNYDHDQAGSRGHKQSQLTIEEQTMRIQSKKRDKEPRQGPNDQQDNKRNASLEAPTTKTQSKNPNEDGMQEGKYTNSNHIRNVVSLSSSDSQMHGNAKGKEAAKWNEQEHGRYSDPNSYHKAFPKISSNFDKHALTTQKSHQITQPNQPNGDNNTNDAQITKENQATEPAPYTVVQTLAARLRQIFDAHATPIELVPPRHTTKQGQPAEKLYPTNSAKWEGWGLNIAHYNAGHVLIDLENELDYNTGKLMRIHTWTPNFRPEEETPIVPIWVLLPRLPWHCFKKEFISPLLESVGKVLYLNTTSIKRTRASMAKVKVQVDLTKTRPRHVWIGLDDEDLTIGRWEPIEYENIPPYCAYCRYQGHRIEECNFKIRDEEYNKRKEAEVGKKSTNNSEQGQQGAENRQTMTREQEEQQQENSRERSSQQQPEQQKEEEWQVQRRRNNKTQEGRIQKIMWRPTSPQSRLTKEQTQNKAQQIGKVIQEPQNRFKADHNQKTQVMQPGKEVNNKSAGIDSMLPTPIDSNISCLDVAVEVEEGMEGGSQEKQTNIQEGVSKRGNLSDVMHEGTHIDHSSDFRAPATTSQPQSPGKQNGGAMAKDMGAKASTSNQGRTPKSKNKSSKKKREAAKKKQNQQQDNDQQGKQQTSGEACKEFIMVDEHLGMDITPLQAHYMNTPLNVPPDKIYEKCHTNKGPVIDEYVVDNSEDEPDMDNQSIKDLGEDDETSEMLIKAFSPYPDKGLEDEIQQNVRGINTQGVLERLKMLKKMHQLSIIAILEPFSDNSQVQNFKNQIDMEHAVSNCNGKIWLFWNRDIDCVVLEEDAQHITCDLGHNELQNHFTTTFVYAKCKDHLRRPLWDIMLYQDAETNKPWCSVGDYNVITSIEEKLGGVPYNMRKSLEFIAIIEACGLMDLGFSGQKFTWSNKKGIQHRVWNRLDRALVNDAWLEKMPQTTVTHLPSVGSDYCPLLMELNGKEEEHIKYFKFLNCWAHHTNFLNTVKTC
ncbi:hypothetical protein H5410_050944 [Solanum commersonii]|uniref:DUF4283 domain-containing protein n=1 Tax=Solanum commersonii TaxID=4109 RepID=A0A9J5WYJ4_SOLCO|nr:hypothetical protein H5410_050944 [Solanum commersonii]